MMKFLSYSFFVLILSGCLGGYSPNSNFYRLKPDIKIYTISDVSANISVEKPAIPEYLDKPQMITFDDDSSEMKINEFNRWGENLDNMIQRQIADDLRVLLPRSQIAIANQNMQTADYNITIHIMNMDMIKQGKIKFSAIWFIQNKQGKILKEKNFVTEKTIIPNYNNYAIESANILREMTIDIAKEISRI